MTTGLFLSKSWRNGWKVYLVFRRTNRRVRPNSTKAGRPKTTMPILAARGSPSNTELTDHAIQKSKRKAPNPAILQAFQSIWYFLFKWIQPNRIKQERNPNKKNSTSIPENIIMYSFLVINKICASINSINVSNRIGLSLESNKLLATSFES